MSAMPLLDQLRDAGLTVTRSGDQIIVAPKKRLTDELRSIIRSHKRELLAILPSVIDPFADFASAIRSGALQQCQACRHFTDLIPSDGDNLGVPEAGWCRRYNVATDPLLPFWCDGYSPTRGNV